MIRLIYLYVLLFIILYVNVFRCGIEMCIYYVMVKDLVGGNDYI